MCIDRLDPGLTDRAAKWVARFINISLTKTAEDQRSCDLCLIEQSSGYSVDHIIISRR